VQATKGNGKLVASDFEFLIGTGAPERDAPPKGLCSGEFRRGTRTENSVVHVVSGHARTANDHIGSLDGGGFMHKSILSAFTHWVDVRRSCL
jgi:hypothetical protein